MTKKRKENLPVLIYDGQCKFCIYWASYWQKLTGDTVVYQPYQEIAANYPSITLSEFQHAVQYISPEGKISRAAEASFLTLSHAPHQRIWLWLYQKLPGFAFCSEKIYAFIAAHRSFFYMLSLFLWGRDYEPSRYDIVSWLFLRGLGFIFLFAFISFGSQALGLIGSHGLLPVQELVTVAQEQLGVERYWLLPMLFWLNDSDLMIQLVCWGGAILSLFLIFNKFPRTSLLLLYIFYLSLLTAGRQFMTFQWDSFLLETGLIAIFLMGTKSIGIWLLRWLLFRFVFAAGLVKMFSGDHAWLDLSALNYYFNTEPLPTPLAWYAHQLPTSVLHAATGITLIIELIVPFLIFFPRRLRFFACFYIMLLQTMILLTGNYNFFNLLTMLLCLVLFDDAALKVILPARWASWILKPKLSYRISPYIVYTFAVVTVSASLVQFHWRFVGNTPESVVWAYRLIDPLHLVNPYGPFAIMTKDRMEIVLEGSNDGENWKEYTFKYKPSDINRRPPWNIPHQPRLDWQMWFAALSSAEDNIWLTRLLERILENSQPVLDLLADNPFPDKPPMYMRAQFYEYRFTTRDERNKSGAWWERRLVRRYYP